MRRSRFVAGLWSSRPDHAEAQTNLAYLLGERGQFEEAVTAYRRAVEIKPGVAQLHCNLALALTQIGSIDEAIAACGRALELQPDTPRRLHNNLGVALARVERFAEAARAYRRALELKPRLCGCSQQPGHRARGTRRV